MNPSPNSLIVSVAHEQPIRKIAIVKATQGVVLLRRREALLKNIDFMEAQIGRLAKMARDARAEILLLTTE